MPIRFNMQELIKDLIAEGYTKASAIAAARKENQKRQKAVVDNVKARNDNLLNRTKLIPKIFT